MDNFALDSLKSDPAKYNMLLSPVPLTPGCWSVECDAFRRACVILVSSLVSESTTPTTPDSHTVTLAFRVTSQCGVKSDAILWQLQFYFSHGIIIIHYFDRLCRNRRPGGQPRVLDTLTPSPHIHSTRSSPQPDDFEYAH